ncbi:MULTISPECIES: enoyl-CoA hydratase [unclassified Streptomyces]|uniref:enoyl-CoA hydratase n=1 Tax=unclassified Streptomyces TaxID=2593676 RepID=UPI00278C3487|nr:MULTISPECIES: enoyl-CoA hydratase [unclassified Streptomyces]
MTPPDGHGALDGVRVLDLTQVMAGPYCTMLLADLGADVIKVEQPNGGDQTRTSMGTPRPGSDTPAFHALNRNKRSVTLDLRTDSDRAEFLRLAAEADVVVENFRPGVADRLGVGYEAVRAVRPDVVYASISGFGQYGPYADRPGYDLIAQGMAGAVSVTGDPEGPPVKCGLPVGDLGAGMLCALSIAAAHVHRLRTGEGQYLETSLYEAVLAMSVWESVEYFSGGEPPQRLGSAHRMSAPYQVVRTKDGHATIAANNQRLWLRLCEALDLQHLADDERFATNTDRMRHRAELIALLEGRLAATSTEECVTQLLDAGVPSGPILDYGQILDHDPHARARGMVEEYDHPVDGRSRVVGFPVKLARTPARLRRHPPVLGEHNSELLRREDELPSDHGEGSVTWTRHPVPGTAAHAAHLTLANPDRLGALTLHMYDQLERACQEIDADPGIRLTVIRGAGGRAFAAGTDIREFRDFASGADGVAYEARVARAVDRLAALRMPVVAAVEGPAVGAGSALASCCDVVLCTPDAVFGAPIGRTLGNCLSPTVMARLYAGLGRARTLRALLAGRLITAAEAYEAGFVAEVVDPADLDARLADLTTEIAGCAPLTLAALKEADRRVLAASAPGHAEDLYARVYGSRDFAEGVAAFLAKRKPDWQGR